MLPDKYSEIKRKISELEKQEAELSQDLRQTLEKLQTKIEIFENKYSNILSEWKKNFKLILLALGFLITILLFFLFLRKKSSEKQKFNLWNFLLYQFVLPFLMEKTLNFVKSLIKN